MNLLFLMLVILNIALGFVLVICPRRAQACPCGLGKEKYTAKKKQKTFTLHNIKCYFFISTVIASIFPLKEKNCFTKEWSTCSSKYFEIGLTDCLQITAKKKSCLILLIKRNKLNLNSLLLMPYIYNKVQGNTSEEGFYLHLTWLARGSLDQWFGSV